MFGSRFITILFGIIFVVQIEEIVGAPGLQKADDDHKELEPPPQPKPFPREELNKALDEFRKILEKSENEIVLLFLLKFHLTADDFETPENIYRKLNQMLDISVQLEYSVEELEEALKDVITRLSTSQNHVIKKFVEALKKITTEQIKRAGEVAGVLGEESSVLHKHFDGVLKELNERLNDSKNPVVQDIVEIIGKAKSAELDNENKLIQILGRPISKKKLSVDEIETAIREVHERLKDSQNFMIQGFAIILNKTTTHDIELMIQLKQIFNVIAGKEKEGKIEDPQSAPEIAAALKKARDIIKEFKSYELRSVAEDFIVAVEENLPNPPLKENSEKDHTLKENSEKDPVLKKNSEKVTKSQKRGIKLQQKKLVVKKNPKSKKDKKEE